MEEISISNNRKTTKMFYWHGTYDLRPTGLLFNINSWHFFLTFLGQLCYSDSSSKEKWIRFLDFKIPHQLYSNTYIVIIFLILTKHLCKMFSLFSPFICPDFLRILKISANIFTAKQHKIVFFLKHSKLSHLAITWSI